MLIKTIRNSVESEWFELTKQIHRELIEDAPDEVIFVIDSIYPRSPDSGALVKLDFACFTVLAREFVLDENRQKKQVKRRYDKRPLDEIAAVEVESTFVTVDDVYQRKELLQRLEQAKQQLTETQYRRLEMYLEDGLSLRKIADLEGVHNTAVEDSIRAALKKLKKYFI